MRIDLLWSGETHPLDLADGTVTVGGGPADDIRLEGLPHGLLTLTLVGEHASVVAQRSVRIGEVLFPARRARLLLVGEALTLPNDVVLRRPTADGAGPARREVGTACLADGLLAGDAAPASRGASLTCVAGDDCGRVFALPFREVHLGRSPEVDVQLADRLVSRRHARLAHRADGLWVTTAPDAMNGLRVNGRLVKKPQRLSSGDVLELGQTMLRYEAAAAPPPAPVLEAEPIAPPRVAEPGPRVTADVVTSPRVLWLATSLMLGGGLLAVAGASVAAAMLRAP